MNLEMKQKWIEALRSGKYKKGIGCLRNLNSEFCCLGVLCDLHDNSKWKILKEENKMYYYENSSGILSADIIKKYSIHNMEQLIKLNDTFNYSFDQIADYIEQNL